MISFAVTAYNEMSEGRLHGQRILDCIRAAQDHPAVDQVMIVDDGSDDYDQLVEKVFHCPRYGVVTIYQNNQNLGVFGNKLEAVAQCTGEWVITCDSDNVQDKTFIDKIVSLEKTPDTWYCPSFAKTHFDYRGLIGEYSLGTIAEMMEKPLAACALNTGNQTVHRGRFMEVFGKYRQQRADLMMPNWLNLTADQRQEKYWRLVFDACDSFIFNMEWLTSGGKLHVVEGLEYDHYYAAGPEGNYTRSPEEKGKLGELLFAELYRMGLAAHVLGGKPT
jgi:glycosyltransferase involved in cell wall biosynthesis